MDPVSAIAAAGAAFHAIKKGIALGRELQDMGAQLGEWSAAISDLNFLEQKSKDPPLHKVLSGSVEREALEIFAAKKKAKEMRQELRVLIQYQYGMEAWDELIAIEAEIRKQRQKAVYAHEKRKQEIVEGLAIVALLALGSLVLFGAVIFFAPGRSVD